MAEPPLGGPGLFRRPRLEAAPAPGLHPGHHPLVRAPLLRGRLVPQAVPGARPRPAPPGQGRRGHSARGRPSPVGASASRGVASLTRRAGPTQLPAVRVDAPSRLPAAALVRRGVGPAAPARAPATAPATIA